MLGLTLGLKNPTLVQPNTNVAVELMSYALTSIITYVDAHFRLSHKTRATGKGINNSLYMQVLIIKLAKRNTQFITQLARIEYAVNKLA